MHRVKNLVVSRGSVSSEFVTCRPPDKHGFIETIERFYCREHFHVRLSKTRVNYFIFSPPLGGSLDYLSDSLDHLSDSLDHSISKAKQIFINLKKTISYVERKLKIKVRSKLTWVEHDQTNSYFREQRLIVFVEMSPFWMMRGTIIKSLFTLLLRAGVQHSYNASKSLEQENYLKHTQYALNRFLKGYTFVNKNKGLWYASTRNFRERPEEHVKKINNLLRKTPKNKKSPTRLLKRARMLRDLS